MDSDLGLCGGRNLKRGHCFVSEGAGERRGRGGGLGAISSPLFIPFSPSDPLSVPGVEMQVGRELEQQRRRSIRQMLAYFSGGEFKGTLIEVQKKKRKVLVLCSRPP